MVSVLIFSTHSFLGNTLTHEHIPFNLLHYLLLSHNIAFCSFAPKSCSYTSILPILHAHQSLGQLISSTLSQNPGFSLT